ncbi:MAG: PKD domain-containing protein [Flavobacteriales bacterium]|nr:PKD domain-containing protein [Flavobacteriales bacterium]
MNAGFQVTVDGHVAHFGGSDSPNQHYNWNFGDGTFGDNAQPAHTYTNPGYIYRLLGGLGLESANAGHVLRRPLRNSLSVVVVRHARI